MGRHRQCGQTNAATVSSSTRHEVWSLVCLPHRGRCDGLTPSLNLSLITATHAQAAAAGHDDDDDDDGDDDDDHYFADDSQVADSVQGTAFCAFHDSPFSILQN